MKLIIPVLFLLLSINTSGQLKKTDRSSKNLLGPVKSTTTVYFYTQEKFGELSKQGKHMTETEEYNKEGWLIASKLEVGSSTTKTAYKYDDSGNLIEKKENEDGDVTLLQAVYNTDGKMIELNTFDKKGALETKLKNKYNEQGQLTTANLYNGDGTLREKETFAYNEKKLLKEITTSNPKGVETKFITYKYNDKGLLQEEAILSSERNEVSLTYLNYRYDDKDRKVSIKRSLPKKKESEETIMEYDQFGNVINEFKSADNYQKDKYSYDGRNNWTGSIYERKNLAIKRKYIIERTIKYY